MEANIMIENLTKELLEINPFLSENKARTWIELLWSDFEATYAKAGHRYKGPEFTERIIRQWVESYGGKLHEFVARNPKYAHLLDEDG